MAFGIAFENGIRYDGRTGGEAHKPRTDRMEKNLSWRRHLTVEWRRMA